MKRFEFNLPKEQDLEETRNVLLKVATSGNDEQIMEMSSDLHIGHMVTQMMDSLAEAKEQMVKDGIDTSEYQPAAVNLITNRLTGETFQLAVNAVGQDVIDAFETAMKRARPLDGDENQTRH